MTELRFGATDSLRCRFSVSPLWEVLAAVRVLHVSSHRRPIYEPWIASRSHLAQGLNLEVLRAVQPHVGHTPDFLAPPPRAKAPQFDSELARVRATPLRRVITELIQSRDAPANPLAERIDQLLADPAGALNQLADGIARAWHGLIEPEWPRIRRILDADVAYRGQQLTDGGLAALFDDLHPTVTWQDDKLVAARYRDHDRDLSGAGLLLIPSAFTWPYLSLIVDTAYQPTLVYPARGTARLWTDTPPPPDRLARLLGRSRAAILAALDLPATTTDLAAQYGLALATVAEHLANLREAGLVTPRRTGHRVRYSRTDLGQALITAAIDDRPR